MGSYCIVIKTKKGILPIIIIGPVDLEAIDRQTTGLVDKNALLDDFLNRQHISMRCNIDDIEDFYIIKDTIKGNQVIGPVFYSDNAQVLNKEENTKALIEKAKDKEFIMRLLEEYVKIAQNERKYVPFEEDINAFLILLQDSETLDWHKKFTELLEVMFKHYGIYRFVYSVNKSLEESEKNKDVKAMVKQETH